MSIDIPTTFVMQERVFNSKRVIVIARHCFQTGGWCFLRKQSFCSQLGTIVIYKKIVRKILAMLIFKHTFWYAGNLFIIYYLKHQCS